MLPGHPRLPLRRGVESNQSADDHRNRRRDGPQLLAAWKRHLDTLLRCEDGSSVTHRGQRQSKIEYQPDDGDHEGNREERGFAAHDRREDLLIADLAEPEPVRVEPE